jgi:hypothetical protein
VVRHEADPMTINIAVLPFCVPAFRGSLSHCSTSVHVLGVEEHQIGVDRRRIGVMMTRAPRVMWQDDQWFRVSERKESK